MSRKARRRSARAFAAGVAALGLGAGLVFASGVVTPPQNAEAAGGNQVYVGGGIANSVWGFSAASLQAGAASPNQLTTTAQTVAALAINVIGTKLILGEPSPRSSTSPPFSVQVEDVASGVVTPAVGVAGQPLAIASDPNKVNVAYVLLNVNGNAEVDRVDAGTSPPGESLFVSTTTLSGLSPTAMAISPDGRTLFVGGEGDGWIDIDAVSVVNPTSVVSWQSNREKWPGGWAPFSLNDLAVSPSDSLLYGAGQQSLPGVPNEGLLFALTLSGSTLPSAAEGAIWSDRLTSGVPGQMPPLDPLSITVSPDASTLYAGGTNELGTASSVDAFAAGSGAHGADAQLSDEATSANQPLAGLASIAMSPDGRFVFATGTDPGDHSFIDVLSSGNLTKVPLSTSLGIRGVRFAPSSPESIAVTPAQLSPPAAFSVNVAQAGQPTTFTAIPPPGFPGMAFSYSWSFGAVGPSASNIFATPGSYSVTLTVTPRSPAGTAVDTPGQTPYWRAIKGSSTQTVVIPALPPPTTAPHTTTTTVPHKPGVPAIVLSPNIGPPGTIVTVSGSGFKPNQHVTISWSLSSGSVKVIADPHGNLPANTQMLILTPDILGPRNAVTNTSPQAKASFLVVPNTAEPGGDNAAFLFRSEGP